MRKIFLSLILALISCVSFFGQEKADCPKIEVLEPKSRVAPGENMNFSAKVSSPESLGQIRYVWKIDRGSIVKGQGTDSIAVSTAGIEEAMITATVEISGLPDKCKKIAVGAGLAIVGGHVYLADEFGKIREEDMEARIEFYFSLFKDRPKALGYIINYGKKSQVAKREKFIKKLIKKYKLEASRFAFSNGGKERSIRTKLWILPI